MTGPRTLAGFSLLELMIVVAILSVIAAFAVPSFQSLISLNRLASEANELIAGLGQARTEAIRLNRRTVLCRATVASGQVNAAGGCVAGNDSWAGWMVFVDADDSGSYNPNAATNPEEVMVRAHVFNGTQLQIAPSAGFATAGNRIVFRPDGLARAAGQTTLQTATLRICEPSTSMQQNARDIRIGGGSRISVSRMTASTCAAPGDS